jgi:hypothetical protein
MKLTVKKSHIFLILILAGVAFACIAPSIDWYGLPKLEGLATENAKVFYAKVFDEKYHEIYVEADEELRNKMTEEVFQATLKSFQSKIKVIPKLEETECIQTSSVSLLDKFKVNNGSSGEIKATCGVYPYKAKEAETFLGNFVWLYKDNNLKLVSFKESVN